MYNKIEYNSKTDIWALGCVFYELCTNDLAFKGDTEQEVKKAICEVEPPRLDQVIVPQLPYANNGSFQSILDR